MVRVNVVLGQTFIKACFVGWDFRWLVRFNNGWGLGEPSNICCLRFFLGFCPLISYQKVSLGSTSTLTTRICVTWPQITTTWNILVSFSCYDPGIQMEEFGAVHTKVLFCHMLVFHNFLFTSFLSGPKYHISFASCEPNDLFTSLTYFHIFSHIIWLFWRFFQIGVKCVTQVEWTKLFVHFLTYFRIFVHLPQIFSHIILFVHLPHIFTYVFTSLTLLSNRFLVPSMSISGVQPILICGPLLSFLSLLSLLSVNNSYHCYLWTFLIILICEQLLSFLSADHCYHSYHSLTILIILICEQIQESKY